MTMVSKNFMSDARSTFTCTTQALGIWVHPFVSEVVTSIASESSKYWVLDTGCFILLTLKLFFIKNSLQYTYNIKLFRVKE